MRYVDLVAYPFKAKKKHQGAIVLIQNGNSGKYFFYCQYNKLTYKDKLCIFLDQGNNFRIHATKCRLPDIFIQNKLSTISSSEH